MSIIIRILRYDLTRKQILMCGRFTLASRAETIADYFGIEEPLQLKPRYNIAPSQDILVLRQLSEKPPQFVWMRWGLIPAWQKEEDIGSQWINARAETIDEKPLFKKLFQKKRCLIVVDGFYEWHVINKQVKQPYYICKKDHGPFVFAGLWEHWENKAGKIIESCTLLTTDANNLLKPIHHRMPVILPKTDFNHWLDSEQQDVKKIKNLLKSYNLSQFTAFPVSNYVNSPRNDNIQCITPLDEQLD